eukprot:gene589-11922_t
MCLLPAYHPADPQDHQVVSHRLTARASKFVLKRWKYWVDICAWITV